MSGYQELQELKQGLSRLQSHYLALQGDRNDSVGRDAAVLAQQQALPMQSGMAEAQSSRAVFLPAPPSELDFRYSPLLADAWLHHDEGYADAMLAAAVAKLDVSQVAPDFFLLYLLPLLAHFAHCFAAQKSYLH
jgi:hypothetical protein